MGNIMGVNKHSGCIDRLIDFAHVLVGMGTDSGSQFVFDFQEDRQ
jgi:hypothetical protein